jgi:hypothetical protein
VGLSNDLISQFVKATRDSTESSKTTTICGTVKIQNGTNPERPKEVYVILDGSNGRLTPVSPTTTDIEDGDRVLVTIKNHVAVITGNFTSPSARTETVQNLGTKLNENVIKVNEFEYVIAEKATIEQLLAEAARINTLETEHASIKGHLDANSASIKILQTDKLDAALANLTYAQIKDLEATNLDVYNLESTYGEFVALTTEQFEALRAQIGDLETEKLSAESANLKYANIDFTNISKAAMEYFYAQSGLIDNVVIGDGTIAGMLVGVTISGDLIEGNTIKAEKLVIRGNDGLYYKLNTDGMTTEAEQTDENSINGTVIQAKSITATKIAVNDLVAFDATIGGFNITDTAIYSEVKDSEGNMTRGLYMDSDGQVNIGDDSNFIRYIRDENGDYKLTISASSVLYALGDRQYSLEDLGKLGNYIHVGTYEGEPCIELGEGDSDFKLLITNTRIMFKEGTGVPAYFTNQSMHIKKAVVEEELQQGGFVWKARANGNLGLVWKGVTS